MIRVDVLGGLRVSAGGRVHEDLPRQPMRAALLVLLAVERSLTRDRVLCLLWPDRDADRGRRALNQTVYELRRSLGEDCIQVSGDAVVAGDHLVSDVGVLQQAAVNGDRAAALELYRGPFLAGVFLATTNEFEDWSDSQRARIARLLRRLRLEHIDELMQAGKPAAALPHALRAVDEDPLEDDFQHRLIELLVATGQRAAALRQFELYRARLAEQGLTPLEHTQELIAGIRGSGDVAGTGPEPAGGSAAATAAPAHRATGPAAPGAGTSAGAAGSPAGGAAEAAVSASRGPRWRPRAGLLLAAALATVLLAGLVVVAIREAGGDAPEAMALAAAPQLTVMAFEDLSPEPRYGYLTRGLTQSLVAGLQRRVPQLRVVALDAPNRGAASPPATDLPGLATSGAALRLEGSLTVVGGSVRVRVQLIDDASGEIVRPIEVQRPWRSELALIDSIVPAIIEEMQAGLGQQLLKRDLRAGTESAQAFALYLRALDAYDAAARLGETHDDLGAERVLAGADSLLQRAEQADRAWARPAVLRARVARARAFVAATLERNLDAARVHELFQTALAHAEQAVARDPASAEALAARAEIRYTISNIATPATALEQRRALVEGALADLHRAVSADPLTSEAWLLLSRLDYLGGDFQKAHASALQAYRADAFLRHERDVLHQLALTAFHLKLDDEAAQWCAEGTRRYPRSTLFLACRSQLFAYAQPPAVDSALALLDEVRRLARFRGAPLFLELNACRALAAAGRGAEARELMTRSLAAGPVIGEAFSLQAAVHTALGETDTALALVQRVAATVPNPRHILLGRELESLRADPRFPRPDRQ